MSPKEVEGVAHREVVPVVPARSWGTHLIRDGTTDVWLTFQNDKLRSIQLAWMQKLKRMHAEPKIDLCANSSPSGYLVRMRQRVADDAGQEFRWQPGELVPKRTQAF